MKRYLTRLFILAIVASLATIAHAGIQMKRSSNRIVSGQWQLSYASGVAGMVYQVNAWWAADCGDIWSVSVPTFVSSRGEYLSGDPNGKEPTVVMSDKKTDYTEWAFEFIAKRSLPKPGREEYREGLEGYDFRIKLANGPFKDWYVGMSDLTEEQTDAPAKVALRPLILTKELSKATVFTYVETKYWTK